MSKFPIAQNDFVKRNGSDTTFFCEGPSMTRQEFAEECDINALMKRYEGHVHGGPGGLPVSGEPQYIDWATAPQTLMEYMELQMEAERGFMTLPAVVRRQFDNSAVAFVEFASDPANLDQMRSWGLAPPVKTPAAGSAEPAGAPPAASSSSPAPGPAAPSAGS